MRTPWRFVADLVSRKPQASSVDAGKPASGEIKALEYQPISEAKTAPPPVAEQPIIELDANEREPAADKAVTLPGSESPGEATKAESAEPETVGAEAPAAEGPEVERSDIEQTDAPNTTPSVSDVSVDGLVDDDAISLPDPVEPKNSEQKPSKPRRQAKRAPRPASAPADDAPRAANAAPPAAPRTFFEEMTDLDTEVAELRNQLAKKLVEQNAQLKKMLDRFPS